MSVVFLWVKDNFTLFTIKSKSLCFCSFWSTCSQFQIHKYCSWSLLQNTPGRTQFSEQTTATHINHVGDCLTKSTDFIPEAYLNSTDLAQSQNPLIKGKPWDSIIHGWMVDKGIVPVQNSHIMWIVALSQECMKFASCGCVHNWLRDSCVNAKATSSFSWLTWSTQVNNLLKRCPLSFSSGTCPWKCSSTCSSSLLTFLSHQSHLTTRISCLTTKILNLKMLDPPIPLPKKKNRCQSHPC